MCSFKLQASGSIQWIYSPPLALTVTSHTEGRKKTPGGSGRRPATDSHCIRGISVSPHPLHPTRVQARRSTWGNRDTDKDLVWGCYDGILPSVPRILNRGWAFYESSISTIFPPANELRYHTQRGHYYTLRTSGPCYRLTMNPRFRQTGTQSSPLRLDDDDNLFVQLPRCTLMAYDP